MTLIGDKIIIKFSKDQMASIFSKKIKCDDGTIKELFLQVQADEADIKRSSQFVQTATVEEVAPEIDEDIKPGDIAIVDYTVMNDMSRIVYMRGGDMYCWINVFTTYHDKDEVSYAYRKRAKDQLMFKKGDFIEMSSLYGIIRGDELISFRPYVFLEHEDNVKSMVSKKGILYQEKQEYYIRKILAFPVDSKFTGLYRKGDSVMVLDRDVFSVKLDEKRKIDCVVDTDILCKEEVLKAITSQ